MDSDVELSPVPVPVLNRIRQALAVLRRLPGVEGVAFARLDGLMIAQILSRSVDHRRVAAISAGLAGTSDMAAEEIGRSEASHTVVATAEGDIVIRKVGEDHVLCVILRPDANLGLILLHIGRASEEIRVALAGVSS